MAAEQELWMPHRVANPLALEQKTIGRSRPWTLRPARDLALGASSRISSSLLPSPPWKASTQRGACRVWSSWGACDWLSPPMGGRAGMALLDQPEISLSRGLVGLRGATQGGRGLRSAPKDQKKKKKKTTKKKKKKKKKKITKKKKKKKAQIKKP